MERTEHNKMVEYFVKNPPKDIHNIPEHVRQLMRNATAEDNIYYRQTRKGNKKSYRLEMSIICDELSEVYSALSEAYSSNDSGNIALNEMKIEKLQKELDYCLSEHLVYAIKLSEKN